MGWMAGGRKEGGKPHKQVGQWTRWTDESQSANLIHPLFLCRFILVFSSHQGVQKETMFGFLYSSDFRSWLVYSCTEIQTLPNLFPFALIGPHFRHRPRDSVV